jgi:hypothetical protein
MIRARRSKSQIEVQQHIKLPYTSDGTREDIAERNRNRLSPDQRFALAFSTLIIVLLVVIWITNR